MSAELAARLREVLLAGRNPDGGWGYHAGNASRLEPTCWALLALLRGGRVEDVPLVQAGIALLGDWQQQGGLVAEPHLPPNLAFNGLASLLFTDVQGSALASPGYEASGRRLEAGIVGVRSRRTWNLFSPVKQDNSLVGWPWTDDAFAWVEPTALCALAVKKASRRHEVPGGIRRTDEAETLLLDRQCPEGGWNYGNAEVLGQALHAYVPPTALVLLALRSRREQPQVRKAVAFLRGRWAREESGLAMGLTLSCFRAYDMPCDDLEARLTGAFERSAFLGNLGVTGLVHYAIASGADGASAFRT